MNVTVLGGGIGGLSAAFYLAARNNVSRINLFEASSRFSGWIKSESGSESTIFESAPRTLRPRGITGNTTLELIQLLELENKIMPIKSDRVAGKFKLIYSGSKITKISPEIDSKLKLLFESDASDNESIHDFTVKKFDNEFAEAVIGPMVRGICAGDSKTISAKFLIKGKESKEFDPVALYDKARKDRWNFYTFQGGLEVLPKTIIQKLSEADQVALHLNSSCQKIEFKSDGSGVEVTINGKVHSTNHIISSLPSFCLAPLVQQQHPELAKELAEMISIDVATVNLHFPSDGIIKEKGFGVFAPSQENPSLVGIMFDSNCVEMKGSTLTVMLSEKFLQDQENIDDQKILEVSLKYVREILGISETPDNFKVNILRKSFPQYTVGHYHRIDRINNYIKENKLPLSLCGQSFYGIGINEVILSAKVAANGF